jgi:hypothetical protein
MKRTTTHEHTIELLRLDLHDAIRMWLRSKGEIPPMDTDLIQFEFSRDVCELADFDDLVCLRIVWSENND